MVELKKNPRKRAKGEHTRDRIIQTAVDLFYERGYARASIRDLARRLEMTNSAMYSHFTSKDEILFAIVQKAGNTVLFTLRKVLEQYDDDPIECLAQMIIHWVCLFEEMPRESSIFASELDQLPKGPRKLCSEQHREIFNILRNKIGELEEKNLIIANDRTLLTFSTLGIINFIYRWYRDDGPLSMKDIAHKIVKMVFLGILRTDIPERYVLNNRYE